MATLTVVSVFIPQIFSITLASRSGTIATSVGQTCFTVAQISVEVFTSITPTVVTEVTIGGSYTSITLDIGIAEGCVLVPIRFAP